MFRWSICILSRVIWKMWVKIHLQLPLIDYINAIFIVIIGGINYFNVVSLFSTFCVTESTTLSNPPFSYSFTILLCRLPKEISKNVFEKNPCWLDYGFKKVTTLLDTHDGLTLGPDITHSTISTLNSFVSVLYQDIIH